MKENFETIINKSKQNLLFKRLLETKKSFTTVNLPHNVFLRQ